MGRAATTLQLIRERMPAGYRLQDTGAPLGERNMWQLMRGERVVKASFQIATILRHVNRLRMGEPGG